MRCRCLNWTRGASDRIIDAARMGQWGLLEPIGEVAAQLFGVVELDAFEAYAVGGRNVVGVVVDEKSAGGL